jgi:hypothetical protein
MEVLTSFQHQSQDRDETRPRRDDTKMRPRQGRDDSKTETRPVQDRDETVTLHFFNLSRLLFCYVYVPTKYCQKLLSIMSKHFVEAFDPRSRLRRDHNQDF